MAEEKKFEKERALCEKEGHRIVVELAEKFKDAEDQIGSLILTTLGASIVIYLTSGVEEEKHPHYIKLISLMLSESLGIEEA